jgi:hypothetical protein
MVPGPGNYQIPSKVKKEILTIKAIEGSSYRIDGKSKRDTIPFSANNSPGPAVYETSH